MRDLPLWSPLAALVLGAAWLLPNAYPPWLAFHKDAWLGAVLWVVALVLLLRRNTSWEYRLDPLAGMVVILVVVAILQWMSGIIYFSGHVLIGVLYLGGAALAIIIGRYWADVDRHQLGNFLFLSLLVAAFGTALFMAFQWFRLEVGLWIQEGVPGRAPYGNLNQPNNAATLLIMGMVALTWYLVCGRLRLSVWVAGNAFLSVFLAMSGSRIGYLSFLLIASALAVAALSRRFLSLPFPIGFRHVLIIVGIFMTAIWAVNTEWQIGQQEATSQIGANVRVFERDLTSARLAVWKAYLDASTVRPWLGFGYEQGLMTQIAAGELGYRLNGLFTWSHNAVIDLITWFGWPVGLTFIAAAVWAVYAWVCQSSDSVDWVFAAVIFPPLMHGMVELPLAFAYFLLPVCLVIGALLSRSSLPSIRLPKTVIVVWTLFTGLLLGATVYDYFRVESAFYTWRFENSRIGKNHPMDIPDTLVLNQFESLLIGLRGSAETLSTDQIKGFEKALMHDPSLTGLQHLAELYIRRGDVAGAQRAANIASLTAKPHMREALAARWRYLSLYNPEFEVIHWAE